MTQERWSAVDQYIDDLLIPSDPVLEEVLRASTLAGLPQIHVSPNLGRLLHLLVRIKGATSVLEIGTLAGYSTIWLARALRPNGRLITLESEPTHAEVARAFFASAGLSEIIDLRLGPALATLPQIAAEGCGPFDVIFIDADKAKLPRLLPPGTSALSPW
jgi:predicted O-methyltransferase YrrM